MSQNIYGRAAAQIRGDSGMPGIQGTVRFYQRRDGTLVVADILGLPKSQTGFFAFHIHEGQDCGGNNFQDVGGHFNPTNAPHPNHAGDLPPLLADHGRAHMEVLTGRFSVEQVIGRTVIIHSNPDDFHTQPAGNSGTKLACGVIKRVV